MRTSLVFASLAAVSAALIVGACSSENGNSSTSSSSSSTGKPSGASSGTGGTGGAGGAAASSGNSGSGGDAVLASYVAGVVTDTKGAPVAGVTISAPGGSQVTSGADGSFNLLVVGSAKTVVAFEKAGFVRTQKRATPITNATVRVDAVLAAAGVTQALDADVGGTLKGARGAELVAPPGVFVDGAGNVVHGAITVALTPLDPSNFNELLAYPGALIATKTGGGTTVLETIGVLDIDARQGTTRLNVKPGMHLTVRIPAPADGTGAASSKLWSMDETTGLWQEEGVASLDTATKTYQVDLPHLSFWNIDSEGPGGCIKGHVVDELGHPIQGAAVATFAIDQVIRSSGGDLTDANGAFSVPNVRGLNISIEVILAPTADMPMTIQSRNGVNGSTTPADPSNIAKDDPACLQVADFVFNQGADAGPHDGGSGGATGDPASCFATPGAAGGDAGPGDAGDGGAQSDPWEGTCGKDLEPIFACFMPSGSCVAKVDSTTSQYVVTWANGAKINWSMGGGLAQGGMFGPTGTFCGSLSGSSSSFAIVAPDGRGWEIYDNNTMMTCPDQSTVTLDQGQQTALGACGAVLSPAAAGTACKTPQVGGCQSDADCAGLPSATSCCMTKGGNLCLDPSDPSACTSIQSLACATDTDCTNSLHCCATAGTNIRLCTGTISCP